jgi:hypothetical protein
MIDKNKNVLNQQENQPIKKEGKESLKDKIGRKIEQLKNLLPKPKNLEQTDKHLKAAIHSKHLKKQKKVQ